MANNNDGSLNFDTKIDSTGFQKGLEGIGGAAKKGLAVTAIGGAAVKVGSDFESGMSQVQAVSGASGEALEQLKEKAKEMGAKTKFSATESAEAMNYMAMAGWKTEEMLNGIEGIMNLAAASGEDLATTSDIVTDALTAFGLTAADSTHFADILAAASSNANTNVGLMGETFKYVAPLAGSLGYSAEDTATAIGLMANAGIKGSQAGTALRSILTRLAKPTKESGTAMNMLGLSITDASGQMKPLSEIIGDMREGFAGLTEDEKASYAAMLGGQEAMSGLLAIVTASDEDFEKLSGAIQNSSYNVDKISQALQKSGVQWEKYSDTAWMASGGMDGLLDEVIYNITEAGTSAEELQKYLRFEYDMDADDAIKTIETVKESLENSKGAAAEIAEIMQDNLQGQITILQSGLEGLGVSLYETMQDTGKNVVKEAQGMVQQLQDAFDQGGFSGLVGSVGDVLAQIVQRIAEAAPAVIDAAVNLVTSFCDGLKSAPGLGDSGAELITALVTGLMSCVGEIWTTAIVLIGKLAEGIAEGAPQMIEAMTTGLTDIIECITDWLPDILLAGGDIILSLVEGIAGAMPSLFTNGISIASTLFEGLMSGLPQIADAGVDLLNTLAEGIASNLPTMIPTAMNALMEFSGTLRANAAQLVDAGLNLIMTLAESLIDNIPVFIETIPTIVTNIAGIINDNAPKLLACGLELLAKLAMGLIQAIPTLIENIPQIIQAIVSVFTAFNWVSLGTNIINFITNGIKSLAASIPNALKNIGQTAMNGLRSINWHTLGSDIISFIVNGVKSLVSAIPNLLKSIGHNAVELFKSIDWLDLGANVIKGIISGISGALDGLWSTLGDVCSGMLGKIKGFFGINSPSTLMAEQGDYLVQGLVNGMADMPDEIAQYLDQTAEQITKWGDQMLKNVQSSLTDLVNTASTAMSQLPAKLTVWLTNTVTKVTAWGQQMLSAAKTAISNMISAIISLLSQLPGKVSAELAKVTSVMVSWGNDIVSKMTQVGRDIVNGIWNGISDNWGWLEDQVKQKARSLLDVAKKELGVNSPSKEFRDEFGRWLFPGAVEGVKKSMPKTLRDMKEQAGELLTAMQGSISASMEVVALNAFTNGGARALTSGGTVVYADNHLEQENVYHVPVATPSETAKAQREAFRKMAGGVK
ncbi:MAG: phage tail tape measure protein [Roseburia sp.]|nr:phage tail tape measure protein [Roseburia sp.]